MNLRKVLSPELISLGLKASTKQEAVEELVDLLMQGGRINDRDAALQAVLERESKMSTGIQHGVAIPHGKTSAVNDLVACVAVKPEGIDFESLDGEPSTIFIMTLSPLNKTGPHVQFLAEISRLLKTAESRERILKVSSKQELLSVLLE
ncbi:PTS sucrose transporter subunit IIABC [Marispirochaeta aestuarii]|uniref:PTS sucrose transporter subunit IIABC n=1 Tax=Marispirochaeta aestuarii TaxID=1963862 RepID=A0A1Y1RTK0_9SPIO|nr:PTS sugar transporter subunit IIA [Marispirochaeta aestuarii]ORC31102.1 PTS sucrose transporter subunit IIABC [Marispirochaeta aestuarii]